mmetsp:Transcript_7577/g.8701  ORF Transcript_7577/g.8701 Transcript_7577/m.8701 type:complete len:764 (+) Transcript_7577:288-2579(+)|eukprot:CAMPEP_0184048990 /NCGR_PEP_ID=MMETSP0956-20121227/3144_1 /TAXON_ID=627963 /ORGANISM="Aplanochytrium sp, Strain PBS07" /LENGTH=763 /DNA_ID=CAMNT_0026341197 /DNA_START=178 /DNA_END=2469 /DNA_ORIENTATION=+
MASDLPETVTDLLGNNVLVSKFELFLEEAFAEEAIHFYKAVVEYEKFAVAGAIPTELLYSKALHIVNYYVKDESEEQVNISSRMVGNILAIMDKGPNATVAELTDIFEVAKREVLQLMDSNFFTPFMRRIRDQMRKEEWLRISESVWRFTGLEDFLSLEAHYEYVMEQHSGLEKFLNLRMGFLEQVKAQLSRRRIFHNHVKTFLDGTFNQLRLPHLSWLLIRVLNLSQLRVKAVQKYINQLTEIWKSLYAANAEYKTAFEVVRDECKNPLKKLFSVRDDLVEIHKKVEALKEPFRQENEDGPIKLPQKVYSKLVKLNEGKAAKFSHLCQLEEEIKSKMQEPFEKFQSLEFGRIETIRDVLNRVSFADYNFSKDNILAIRPILAYVEENDILSDAKTYATYDIFQASPDYAVSDPLEGAIEFTKEDLMGLKKILDNVEDGIKSVFKAQDLLVTEILGLYEKNALESSVALMKNENDRQSRAYPSDEVVAVDEGLQNEIVALVTETVPGEGDEQGPTRNTPTLEKSLGVFYSQGTSIPVATTEFLTKTAQECQEIVNRSLPSEQSSFMQANEIFIQSTRKYGEEAKVFEHEVNEYREMKRETVHLLREMRYADEEKQIMLVSRYSEVEEKLKQYEDILTMTMFARNDAVESKIKSCHTLIEGRLLRILNALTRLFTGQLKQLESFQSSFMDATITIDPIYDIEFVANNKIYHRDDYFEMGKVFAMLGDKADYNAKGKSGKNRLQRVGSFLIGENVSRSFSKKSTK